MPFDDLFDDPFLTGPGERATLAYSLAAESASNRRRMTANDSYGQPWECVLPRRGLKKGDAAWNGSSGFASREQPAPAPAT